jgi:hypothetical protein
MAISVLNLRSLRSNGTSFPLSSYEEPYGTIEDRVQLPRAALEMEASQEGLVKVVFFSYKHLDELLAQFFQQQQAGRRRGSASGRRRVLNSRIISAAIVRRGATIGGGITSGPGAAQVVLRHLREDEGLTAPACATWDTEAGAWTEARCRVVAARPRDTVCECDMDPEGAAAMHLGLLMEEAGEENGGLVTTVVQLPAFHVEIIVASVAAGLLLILLLLLVKVSTALPLYRMQCSGSARIRYFWASRIRILKYY